MAKPFLKFLLISLVLIPFIVGAYISPGAPTGHVNDFAGMLQIEERQELEEKLVGYRIQTSHEISVVTIPTVGTDETIETYAEKLFQEWGIGKKDKDDGALLLIARDDKKFRIEVGYGLEPELTDLESGRILRDTLTPAFQEGNYYEGIDAGIDGMISAISVESAVPENQLNSLENISGFSPQILFVPFMLLMWLGSMLARSKSWWAGGIVGGILGAIALSFGFTAIAIPILIALGLFSDFIVSRGYNNSRRHHVRPPWWTGGGGFGGGFGGRGGGGFGGFGGGRSGGGGASGGW